MKDGLYEYNKRIEQLDGPNEYEVMRQRLAKEEHERGQGGKSWRHFYYKCYYKDGSYIIKELELKT
jgi:hypothetical protein